MDIWLQAISEGEQCIASVLISVYAYIALVIDNQNFFKCVLSLTVFLTQWSNILSPLLHFVLQAR